MLRSVRLSVCPSVACPLSGLVHAPISDAEFKDTVEVSGPTPQNGNGECCARSWQSWTNFVLEQLHVDLRRIVFLEPRTYFKSRSHGVLSGADTRGVIEIIESNTLFTL